MPDNAAFILALYAVGMVAIVAEMILPGAIIGLCGAAAVIVAIVMAYNTDSAVFAHTLLGIAVASVPLYFVLWVKVLGRFMTRRESLKATVTPPGREALMGKQGVAITKLRPAGTARIDGQRVDVMAHGQIIEANTRIEVVEVEGNRVVVREMNA